MRLKTARAFRSPIFDGSSVFFRYTVFPLVPESFYLFLVWTALVCPLQCQSDETSHHQPARAGYSQLRIVKKLNILCRDCPPACPRASSTANLEQFRHVRHQWSATLKSLTRGSHFSVSVLLTKGQWLTHACSQPMKKMTKKFAYWFCFVATAAPGLNNIRLVLVKVISPWSGGPLIFEAKSPIRSY